MKDLYLYITGGRNYYLTRKDFALLDSIAASRNVVGLVQGGASGADTMAARWAYWKGVEVTTFKPDWGAHGPAAGPIRNSEMVFSALTRQAEGFDVILVAFPGNRGTADMVGKAKRAGLAIWDAAEIHATGRRPE